MQDVIYRYNVINIDSASTFARVSGRYCNNCRDVYLVVLGGEEKAVKSEFENMEYMIKNTTKERNIIYRKVDKLSSPRLGEEIEYYQNCYNLWTKSGHIFLKTKSTDGNKLLSMRLGNALKYVCGMYENARPDITESIRKNFVIKLIFWFDEIFQISLFDWNDNSQIKIMADNVSKDMEAYFYYMLTRIGADVLIHPTKELKLPKIIEQTANVINARYEELKKVTLSEQIVDERQGKQKSQPVNIIHSQKTAKTSLRCEKSFEELAQLAKSVVMIAVHDDKNDIIGTGSGIMIGKKGFILTNNHVILKGAFFSVRVENDDNTYQTDEIIKYNPNADMAVIRIDRELEPIPMYKGEKQLVRGQKVVAIGSPLGLFNSVSDGIISGFRKINDIDMIQFTAPTSHGSSGGALLNMYGEVIGMSSAGFDDGQNINLAVTYDDINPFIRGFI